MRSRIPSISLGTFAGVPIALHGSVLIVLLVLTTEVGLDSFGALLFGLAAIASLLLHALIHVFVGRTLGTPETHTIVLLPFGDVYSRGTRLVATSLSQRLRLAAVLLSPALVHIILALLLYPSINATPTPEGQLSTRLATDPIFHLFLIQATLGVLNLLPFEPLDAGRVFRVFASGVAQPSTQENRQIAGDEPNTAPEADNDPRLVSLSLIKTGQIVAICAGLFSLLMGMLTPFVLCVLIIVASMEVVMEETALVASTGLQAREVMRPAQSIDLFSHGITVTKALAVARSSFQDSFPIVLQGRFVGLVDRRTLLMAASQPESAGKLIAEYAAPASVVVAPGTPVPEVLAKADLHAGPIIVADGDQFEGIILPEQLAEILVASSLRSTSPPDDNNPTFFE